MKIIFRNTLIGTLMGLLLPGLIACSKGNDYTDVDNACIIDVKADGTTLLINASLGLAASFNFSYSERELEILLHMKEEEKLARDVYIALYDKWSIPVFNNISKAENTHMNAVIFLLNKYGEKFTAVEKAGKFTSPDFQKMYDQLVVKGSKSRVEAFKVGALIEDLDIKDLMDYLDEVTNENIIMVFENLAKGSRNHLRAFNRHLVRLGVTYTPEYISQDEFDKIISSPHEAGNIYYRGRGVSKN